MIKNSVRDIKIDVERLRGFYRGVVEDNKDPLKAGRVRVRIHGLHTPKKIKSDLEGIPTDELPWAEPCMPIQEGSVSGFGSWAVPLQGSQVMLFFENENPTQPRYFASMPGIPDSQTQYSNRDGDISKKEGFCDPDEAYPVKGRLGEPDVHRLARGITDETLVTTKNQQRVIGVQTAFGGNWSEPISPYKAQYPHNHVIATHGGITIELDSTPGATRLNLHHPSNSYIEIDNDGNMVVRNNTEKYEIVAGGKNIYIKQQRNITIGQTSKKAIGEDEAIEVFGDKVEQIGGDFSQDIGNNKSEDIGGNKSEEISGNKSEEITGNKNETIGGSKTKSIGGSETDDITGSKTETIGGSLNITVTGNASITAPVITLQGLTNIIGQIVATGGGGGTMQGTLTVSTDVIAGGKSLVNHVHADPQGGNTSPPL